jgi:hypothetical protein
MAAAVDDFLTDLPEVRQSPLAPRTSFQEELLEAYDRAVETASVPRHRTRPVERRFPLAGLRSSRIHRSGQ